MALGKTKDDEGDGSALGADMFTEDMETRDLSEEHRDMVCFAHQMPSAQYKEQGVHYTQQAVWALTQSPEYKQHVQRCKSCGSSWYQGAWSDGCKECGGFPMERPCCICEGKCGALWTRSIDMSHRIGEAHWDGHCLLSAQEQQVYLLKNVVKMDDEDLVSAMEDLGASSTHKH